MIVVLVANCLLISFPNGFGNAFTVTIDQSKTNRAVIPQRLKALKALPQKVEVCGFKDCRRAGGGARLEKLVNMVLEENGEEDLVKVEICDCQGECGYGPNLVIDGKLVNRVKGKEAVVKALGLEDESNQKE